MYNFFDFLWNGLYYKTSSHYINHTLGVDSVDETEVKYFMILCSVKGTAIVGFTFQFWINILKTKRNLLYIRNQIVPRSKHFPPRL